MDEQSPFASPQSQPELPEEPVQDERQQWADGPQLTFRAIVTGCLVGSIIACTNIYIGLKIGWTFGASIISAVLGFSFFAVINDRLSVMETNIAQTSGSAAGSMASAAGLVAAIPAMQLMGYQITWWELMLWSLAVAFLGVFFAVPLRRQMVLVDQLKFPTGTATAETITAMYSEASVAIAKARVLLFAGLFAGLFTLAYYFVPELEQPPIAEWTGVAVLATMSAWGFKVYLGPALLGAGFLIGPRVVLSLLGGAIIGWGILGPFAQSQGWAPGEVNSYSDGPRGWILWPGVALMVSEALASVAFSWRTFIRALQGVAAAAEGGSDDSAESIPNMWWIIGLAIGSLLTMVIAQLVFGIAWYFSLLAIALSSVLSVVAVRSTGETDINPVGGMGKVTQLVFGGFAPGQISTNLMCAAITGAGASQAADMMQDLKTGHLLGASPRKQFIAQIIGILAGIVFVVPAYMLFTKAYTIGGEDGLPAPAAFAWKAMAELLAEGFGALPPYSPHIVMAAAVVGVVLAVLRRFQSIGPYVPSGLALGIAFIVPPYYSLVMVYGLVIWLIWKWLSPQSCRNFDFAIASGLIAGEGLMGIVNAVLTILGVPTLSELLFGA
ncbi:OPT/YSL family transporter [Aeoliella sp. ICT_H6.2]|uniref:OPT/YSL family transporter n=1 Tax=Aeoliella straminimaris TaxID=2954799 RepID=A0A9X2JH90_9BACT|nr:OPT family oligopeptide transporter [Aeoliella straminimaris]MCO6044383.1 OPT/YSL family transporter [Aeoliella straminimaris]